MNIFILEDEIYKYPRNKLTKVLEKHVLTLATSCDDAINCYVGPYDLLLLDHDMEGEYEYRENYHNTGLQFVKWLVENVNGPMPQVILHSQNGVGRKAMKLLLEENGFDVSECPFGPAYVKALQEQLG